MSERGMKKWAPYKSLNEQQGYLDKLHEKQEKTERPRISSDEAENINDRITDHEQRLARPFDMTTEQRSIFYYFKPFLKASVITTLIMLVPTYFWASIAEFLAQEHGDHTHYAFRVAFLFPAGVFILISAIGILVAKRKLKLFMESEVRR